MRHLIIGNGVAGVSAAETLRGFDPEGDIRCHIEAKRKALGLPAERVAG